MRVAPIHTPKPGADAPHAVTFFLTERERAQVIARLRKLHRRRADALLLALGIRAQARGTRA